MPVVKAWGSLFGVVCGPLMAAPKGPEMSDFAAAPAAKTAGT
jgi:hypothetical protein